MRGHSPSPSWCLCQKLSLAHFHCNLSPGPETKSSSEITNLTPFTVSYHCIAGGFFTTEPPGKPIGLDIFNFGRTKRLINWGGKRQPFPEQAKLGSLYLWMLHISQLIFTNSFTNKEVNLPEWRNQEANGHGRSSGNQECGLAQTGYQWVKFPLLVNERTIVIIPPLTDYKETTS